MYFIGIISERQIYETLEKNLQKFDNKNQITLVNINNKSIENLKNVKFDAIVIGDTIEKLKEKVEKLEKMCDNLEYLVINADIKIKNNILPNIKATIITYGGNHKATITFSSVREDTILISVQRSFFNKKGKLIEVGDYSGSLNKEDRTNLYEILAEFIIKKLYFY
ncbi:MAG: hypothetical protein IKF38_00265 [Clostridia bacterium]|nr:hypothetical protein [Clostridia bacterium]